MDDFLAGIKGYLVHVLDQGFQVLLGNLLLEGGSVDVPPALDAVDVLSCDTHEYFGEFYARFFLRFVYG